MATSAELTLAQILDWLEGRLSASEAATVAAQVAAADDTLQAEVAWARAFLQVGQLVVVQTPPPAVHQKLQQLFAEHWQKRRTTTAETDDQPGFFQRLVAALTFDSYLQPGLAGVRSAETMTTRQLLYSTDVADVALNLQQERTQSSHTLFGQFLPTAADVSTMCSVQLLRNEREVGITQTDELGEFAFANLPVGAYQLILNTDHHELLLPVFALGDSA